MMTLYELRSSAGWTQTELAEKIGVSRQSIVWWETGRNVPFGKNLIKLARAFGIDPGQIEWRRKDDTKRILDLIDSETGELLDYEAFEQLSMEREQKIESMALWAKEMAAEAAAIKHEETMLAERRKALERRADGLKRYLAVATGGEKFSTPRCVVSFRKIQRVVPGDGFIQWAMENGRDDLLKYAEPTVSLTAVKAALAAGEAVPAKIEYGVSVGVK